MIINTLDSTVIGIKEKEKESEMNWRGLAGISILQARTGHSILDPPPTCTFISVTAEKASQQDLSVMCGSILWVYLLGNSDCHILILKRIHNDVCFYDVDLHCDSNWNNGSLILILSLFLPLQLFPPWPGVWSAPWLPAECQFLLLNFK
jgi:hypothetical protein